MPSFPIVDSHVHLYDPEAVGYPWMPSVPKLNRPHLPADFDRMTAGVEVDGIVFVEVDAARDAHMKEVAWISKLAQQEPRIKAIVANLPMDRGAAVEADMARFAEVPQARGVRQLIQSHLDEPGWCLRENFVSAMRLLPKYNLSFDLCLYHPQLADAIKLVRRCPDVRFVLDHIAKPGIKAGLTEPWQSEMATLAQSPNVWCKISGVVTEADHQSWREDEVSPYIRHALACFGYGRVMFGGDWPVSELATNYQRWVALMDDVLKAAPESAKRAVFRDNAISFYRMKM